MPKKHKIKGSHIKLVLEFSKFEGATTGRTLKTINEKIAVVSAGIKLDPKLLYSIILNDTVVPDSILNRLQKYGLLMPDINLSPEKSGGGRSAMDSTASGKLTSKKINKASTNQEVLSYATIMVKKWSIDHLETGD